MAPSQLQLPVSAVGPVDVGRMLREAEKLDDFLCSAAVRQTGEPMMLPKTSKLLDEFMQVNQINALAEEERQQLLTLLRSVKKNAPIVHMSFSADPSPQFMSKLVLWLRQNVHPYVLVRVGLQPNIGAGCVIRTTNKFFDFSLRQHFAKHYQFFVDKLHETVEEGPAIPEPVAAAAEQVAPAEAAR